MAKEYCKFRNSKWELSGRRIRSLILRLSRRYDSYHSHKETSELNASNYARYSTIRLSGENISVHTTSKELWNGLTINMIQTGMQLLE